MKDRTDECLIAEVQRGDASGLTVLFERYYRVVFQIAKRVLRDRAEAEDVMQEVFLEIFRKASLFDPSRGSFRTWLLQYAYHRSFNRKKYLALRSFYDESPATALADADLAGEYGPRDGLTAHDWRQVLLRGMQELTPKERLMIHAVAFDGRTVREAAETIDESYVNGRNLYYRGLRKLRNFVNQTGRRERQVVDDVQS